RGPAGGHADAPRRAAAALVQGRGAQSRGGAWDARADGLAPAVPRPRSRDPDHRRGHRRAARDPAPGRRRAAGGGAASGAVWRVVAVVRGAAGGALGRSEEHTSELQSLAYLVCRLLLEKKKDWLR